MGRARYEFDPGKRYFSWVVAARLAELPSVGRSLSAVKVTLATPYVIEDRLLRSSARFEAVVWTLLGDPDGTRFLDETGVTCDADRVTIPGDPRAVPRLACQFGLPRGSRRYQPLLKWDVLDPGSYPVEPVVVADAPDCGLDLDVPSSVGRRNGLTVSLGRVEFPIAAALRRAYPGRVSVAALRDAVPSWDQYTDETAIKQAVSTLRKKVRDLGLNITDKSGDLGWAFTII